MENNYNMKKTLKFNVDLTYVYYNKHDQRQNNEK